jgi:hypothetical protein
MFETPDFRQQLKDAVGQAASRADVITYDPAIIDFLQSLAAGNEEELMDVEARQPEESRKGVTHALRSASDLISDAAETYRRTGRHRTHLTVADVANAYRAKFCNFWPFCKPTT